MDQIGRITSSANVVPVITAAAYSANNQVGGIQTLAGVGVRPGRNVSLLTVSVTDKAKQNAALVLYFFNDLPVVASSDKTAISITAAVMDANCVGIVTLPAVNYNDTGTASVGVVSGSSLELNMSPNDATNIGSLYVVVKTTGTPTYASTSDLRFRYIFSVDL